jgi:hypothetical protein
VTLNGEPILSYKVENRYGIEFMSAAGRVPGMISLYEEMSVRVDCGYNIHEWKLLSAEERALEVAHYRIRKAVEYQISLAEEKYIANSSRRHK